MSETQKRTRITVLCLQDWLSLALSVILITCTVFAISNGSCSTPQSLTAKTPVCIGGWLSVQSWLAIVGVELSLLSTTVLPRAKNIFLSKVLHPPFDQEWIAAVHAFECAG